MDYNKQLFQENLTALRSIDPEWANLIVPSTVSQWTFVKRGQDVLDLEKVDKEGKVFLHISEDPIAEADAWIMREQIRQHTILFIYGVGLGYYYIALKQWLLENPSRLLIFFEDDSDVMRCFLHTENARELLKDRQVRLYPLKFPVEQSYKILDFLTDALVLDSYALCCFEHYKILNRQNWVSLKNFMAYTFQLKHAQVAEFIDLGKNYYYNYYSNLLKLPQSYFGDHLFGKFKGIPAIICGAGPSLKKNIELLKTLKDRALIFSGGSGTTVINSFGMNPHFGVAIDPNMTQISRIVSLTSFEIPFFYRNRLYYEALEFIHGPHLYNTGAGGYSLPGYFEKELGVLADEPIDEGHNVINYALNLAYAMGCNPIITVGVDLAYSDHESYPPGLKVHALHDFKVDFKTKQSKEELLIKKDIYGRDVFTLWKWIRESDWYSYFAKTTLDVKLINATEGGIGFEGVENLTLQEVADRYLPDYHDLLGRVHNAVQDAHFGKEVYLENIERAVKELVTSASTSYILCEKIASTHETAVKNLLLEKEVPCENSRDLPRLIRELEEQSAYNYILKDFTEHYLSVFSKRIKLYQEGDKSKKEETEALMKAELQFGLFKFLKLVLENHNAIVSHILEKHQTGLTKEVEDVNYTAVKKSSERPKDCLEGLSCFYSESGHLTAETRFTQGKREGVALLYYNSGRLYARLNYRDNEFHGKQEYFYPDGQPRSLICYENGVLDGDVCLYYPRNRLKKKTSYRKGKRHGKELLLRENGSPWIEAEYFEDKPTGQAKLWRVDGRLARSMEYDENGCVKVDQNVASGGQQVAAIEMGYFEQLMHLTNQFTESIEKMVVKVQTLLPHLGGLEKVEMGKTQNQLEELKEQLSHLEELNDLIQTTFSGSPEQEAFWQTDELRTKIEGQLGVLLKQMTNDMISIEHFVTLTEKKMIERQKNKLG